MWIRFGEIPPAELPADRVNDLLAGGFRDDVADHFCGVNTGAGTMECRRRSERTIPAHSIAASFACRLVTPAKIVGCDLVGVGTSGVRYWVALGTSTSCISVEHSILYNCVRDLADVGVTSATISSSQFRRSRQEGRRVIRDKHRETHYGNGDDGR
ncbi:hypothetical protein [Sinorhizobium sp. FG01]|uniref:hypothetical protein n=1 Tax=Sinorhizobium sp. FG01 TaxID=1538168 RepID=UPI001AF00FAE|nr:hypothetical protein [Sinorhizobium sp. FG01]